MAKDRRGGQNGAKLGRTREQDRTIKKIAKQTANLKKEQYRIVDANGDILLKKKGIEGEVAATAGEKREYLNGNISIHNHPAGGTFSPPDIRDFGYGAREIVAASPEGTYRLVNAKFDTKQRYDGWMELQKGMKNIPEASAVALRKQAQENMANSQSARQIKAISQRWSEIRAKDGNEAAQKYYDSVKTKFDEATEHHKQEVRAEERRLEVQPFHDYLRANAAKYGFIYRFEPVKKRK